MMEDNYHVFKNGVLKREDDTLCFREFTDQDARMSSDMTGDGDLHHIPIKNVAGVYLHGQTRFNTRCLDFLSDNNVLLHVFNWGEYYSGTYAPREANVSGDVVTAQANAQQTREDKVEIAQQIVRGIISEMITNLKYYDDIEKINTAISSLSAQAHDVTSQDSVDGVMGVEGDARKTYYTAFNAILKDEFVFVQREYNPPPNEVNALISFGNSLLYTAVLREIHCTKLHPAISFVHSPRERRYSLALDIADIFKPLLVDKLIFRLVNRGSITISDFTDEVGKCLLKEDGKKMFVKAFEEELEKTVKHKSLDRHVSYQYLLRLELFKLQKRVVAGEAYDVFSRWW
jgi:CRISPR-associated protein Cas1